MWVVTKEAMIIVGVVVLMGLLGLVYFMQPKVPPAAPAVTAQAAAPLVRPIVVPPPAEVVTSSASPTRPVAAIDGVIYGGEYPHSTEAAGFEIHWSNDSRSLRVGLISPGLGYLSIGFDPVYRMEGANCILGAVVDGKVVVRDDYGTGQVTHAADTASGGTSDILEAAGLEAGGKTYLEFVIPLNSGDAMDKALVPGETYKVIVAYQETNDDFGAWHSRRGSGSITLDPP